MINGITKIMIDFKASRKWCLERYGEKYGEMIVAFAHSIQSAKDTAKGYVSYIQSCEHLMASKQEELDDAAEEHNQDEIWPMEAWNHLMKAACYELITKAKKIK